MSEKQQYSSNLKYVLWSTIILWSPTTPKSQRDLGVVGGLVLLYFLTRISCRWQTRATRCIMANVLQTKCTLSVIYLRPNLVDNASRRKSPIFSYRTCIQPIPHSRFEFCRDFRQQKTRVSGLSCGVVCVILRLAVSVEHRLVTDEQRDGQTDTRRQLIPAISSIALVRIYCWFFFERSFNIGQHLAKLWG